MLSTDDHMADFATAYRHLARGTAVASGSPLAAILAVSSVLTWLACGPYFHFSDTWQLVMNTVSSIVTFVMVFLIQYSQNRDSAETAVKINELIRAVGGARNSVIALDDLSDEELSTLQGELKELAERYRIQQPLIDPRHWEEVQARRARPAVPR